MSRLIDADAIKEAVDRQVEIIHERAKKDGDVMLLEVAGILDRGLKRFIDLAPTVRPVLHVQGGTWQPLGGVRFMWWKCSICDSISDQSTKYCPHCGALMDGGAKNDD